MFDQDWTYQWAVRETNTYIVYFRGTRQFEISFDQDDTKLIDAMIDRMNGDIPPVHDWEEGVALLEPTINNWDASLYRKLR